MAGVSSHGTTISINSDVIKSVREITLPSAETEDIDITVLDDMAKVTVGGDTDYGVVDFEINYDPAEFSHITLRELAASKESQNWTVGMVDSGGEEWAFSGWVKKFSVSAPVFGVYGAAVSIKVTGLPVVS
jgi:hypothetical protein